MAEHRFCKPTVVGSTPTLGSNRFRARFDLGVPDRALDSVRNRRICANV
jgi:hypothetical protein